MEVRVGGRYRLLEKINRGKGSEIWKAVDVANKKHFAVKLLKNRKKGAGVEREAKIYELLRNLEGFANVYWHGFEDKDIVLVLDLLGPSLEDLIIKQQKFSIQTVCSLAIDIIEKVRILHSRNIIHRDLKPEDILLQSEGSQTLYLIDFDLSKSYKDSKNTHIPYLEGKPFIGNARYGSLNSHLGIENSRRDDLESLGYMLIYLLNGKLPWQGIKAYTSAEKYNKITEKKLSMIIEVLCEGLPSEFAQYIQYTRSLRFEERPQYEYLKNLFLGLRSKMQDPPYIYDWADPIENESEESLEVSKKSDKN